MLIRKSHESLGFPGKPRVLDSWLSTRDFQEVVESVESQGTPHFRGFPRFHCLLESQESCYSQKSGRAWKVRKKCSTLSWLSPTCKKARKARNDSQLSRIPRFLGKRRIPYPKSLEKHENPGKYSMYFPDFSLYAKNTYIFSTHTLKAWKRIGLSTFLWFSNA